MSGLAPANEAASVELTRLRHEVKAKLFGGEAEAVRIGRFRVRSVLGRGGMGIVYRAEDETLGRQVALKLLRPDVGAADGGRGGRRLAGEAQSLARLSHPNVVAVFDVGEHEGQRFIAMEYVEGQTLREWLRAPREVGDILEIFTQAGRGLAAAHAVGLVHRDFKPDNVLVGSDGRARVLDFGLARPPGAVDGEGSEPPALEAGADPLATSLTREGALLGTPAYMAPEQHLGDAADARSDQFAFCVALFESLVGERPFVSRDLRSLSLAIVGGKRRAIAAGPHGEIPAHVRAVLERGLQVDPSARFPDMETLLAALGSREPVLSASTSAVNGEAARRVAPGVVTPVDPLGLDELGLDTVEIERALGLEGLGGGPSGRPRLEPHELAAVVEEAGLDPEEARARLREVAAARHGLVAAAAPAPLVSAGSAVGGSWLAGAAAGHLARRAPRFLSAGGHGGHGGHFGRGAATPEKFVAGYRTNVTEEYRIAQRFDPRLAPALGRVLDRTFGEVGQCEFIGPTFVWSSENAEVSLVPRGPETHIALEMDLTTDAKRRRRRSMRGFGVMGFFFGLFISVSGGLMDGPDGEVAVFLLALWSTIGATIGHLWGRRGHKKLVEAVRERLAWTAGRVDSLLAPPTNDSVAALESGESYR